MIDILDAFFGSMLLTIIMLPTWRPTFLVRHPKGDRRNQANPSIMPG